MKELEGISPKTLSDTLKVLEQEGLIQKEIFKEIPPRVEYTLKEDGLELRKAIIPLIRWAAKRETDGEEKCYHEQCKIAAHHIEEDK